MISLAIWWGHVSPSHAGLLPRGKSWMMELNLYFNILPSLLWKPLRQTLLLTVLQRDGHLWWSLHSCGPVDVKWHISWETTADSKWTEGRQGRWVIQSSLEYNALARKVMCSIHEKQDSRPLPSKATVCSSPHVQTPPEAGGICGGGWALSGWVWR